VVYLTGKLTAQAAHRKLSLAVGEDRFESLSSRCTCSLSIKEDLRELRKEAETAVETCLRYSALDRLAQWESVQAEWWFDESYLGANLAPVCSYFEVLVQYAGLPRARGTGHSIEAWVNARDIRGVCNDAVAVLSSLTEA